MLTPGPASASPDTGNPIPGEFVEHPTRAYLAQLPVAQLSSQVELIAQQDTTISSYVLIVPPGVPITAASEVLDEDQRRYRVSGQPAERRGLGRRVQFVAAALHRISDLQA